jgi:purine-cytosine permease-like protein
MDNKNNQHAITTIETFGVEQIPDAERNATPTDLFRMIFGGANTFATAVLGSFPVLFGLSFQAGAWAIVLGVLVGALILAPMGLFGPINGTNNAVSSGAHFGVHGRIVGSFLSLLTAIAFFSLSVWSSGDALVGGAKRLFGLPETDLTLGLAYGLFAVLVLVVCIYGFRFMLLVNKIAVWAASLLFLLGVFAFAGPFDAGYAGSVQLGSAGFWAAFIGATLLAMSNPVSFGAFLGDWARYIPRETSKKRIMLAVLLSQLATLIPFFFGLVTATIVAVKAPDYIAANNYVGGLLAISPSWFFLPACPPAPPRCTAPAWTCPACSRACSTACRPPCSSACCRSPSSSSAASPPTWCRACPPSPC